MALLLIEVISGKMFLSCGFSKKIIFSLLRTNGGIDIKRFKMALLLIELISGKNF